MMALFMGFVLWHSPGTQTMAAKGVVLIVDWVFGLPAFGRIRRLLQHGALPDAAQGH